MRFGTLCSVISPEHRDAQGPVPQLSHAMQYACFQHPRHDNEQKTPAPVVGVGKHTSSRTRMEGPGTSSMAMLRRRFSPPEIPRISGVPKEGKNK